MHFFTKNTIFIRDILRYFIDIVTHFIKYYTKPITCKIKLYENGTKKFS